MCVCCVGVDVVLWFVMFLLVSFLCLVFIPVFVFDASFCFVVLVLMLVYLLLFLPFHVSMFGECVVLFRVMLCLLLFVFVCFRFCRCVLCLLVFVVCLVACLFACLFLLSRLCACFVVLSFFWFGSLFVLCVVSFC